MTTLTIPSALHRVLVVEPNDDIRLLYREVLGRTADVIEAFDGRDALTKAFVRTPSCVITELRLPFIDGFALCEILRRDRSTAKVPILVVTAEMRPAEIERASRITDAVLRKPTTPDALAAELARLMAPRAPLHSAARAHARFRTTTPPAPTPDLSCPSCDHPLQYVCSHVGGVSDRQPEQWDYFICARCGTFQYRQRTRKLRRVDTAPGDAGRQTSAGKRSS